MNHGAAVKVYTRWMAVPAPEAIKAQLAAALAELHVEAGWCCYDSGRDGTGYLTRALRLAAETGDAYATWGAGATLVRNGHPNDALKLFQLGGFSASKSARAATRPDYPRLPPTADPHRAAEPEFRDPLRIHGRPHEATRYLAKAHDGWEPRDAVERAGMDRATAGIHLDLGQLEAAEQFAPARCAPTARATAGAAH